MKTLYLLRHAKAEPGGKGLSDPERSLAARGREACAAMGAYMKEKRYIPALTLSSSSLRTRQTLELVSQEAEMKSARQFEDALYLATAGEILQAVQGVDAGKASIMVVGHNPGMHHIALLLSKPERTKFRMELELKYPTCALAVLQFDGGWKDIAPGGGTLTDFITPRDL